MSFYMRSLIKIVHTIFQMTTKIKEKNLYWNCYFNYLTFIMLFPSLPAIWSMMLINTNSSWISAKYYDCCYIKKWTVIPNYLKLFTYYFLLYIFVFIFNTHLSYCKNMLINRIHILRILFEGRLAWVKFKP